MYRLKPTLYRKRKLLQFFVLEITARSAANILGIQSNSARLFYRKIRQVTAYRLDLKA
ncbi:IS1595 family transposase, partial [Neisseria sp. 19428wB4_WF04]|nr:IS1595 family transposase [Neisseria sp. 19428wB4_WF04]